MPRRRSSERVRRSAAAGAAFVLVALTALATGTPATADVPAPGEGEAVVTVRVGATGSRPGRSRRCRASSSGCTRTRPRPSPWTRAGACARRTPTATAPSSCPTRGGRCQRGARFVVRQVSAPDGWYTNPTLRTGAGSGSGSVARPYEFPHAAAHGGADGQLARRDTDVHVRQRGQRSTETDSEGVWQQSRTNPAFAAQCGVDVALVLDLSASSGARWRTSRPRPTRSPTRSSGPRRAWRSSRSTGRRPRRTARTSRRSSPCRRSRARTRSRPGTRVGTGSGTNWDQALWSVAQAAPDYQVVVLLTDGNPTRFSADPLLGSGGTTHFRDVENGSTPPTPSRRGVPASRSGSGAASTT